MFQPVDHRSSYKKHLLRVTNCDATLAAVQYGVPQLFFTSEDNGISQDDSDFLHNVNLYKEFATQDKKVGRLVYLTHEYYPNLFALVVRKTKRDPFSYRYFEYSLTELRNMLKIMKIDSVSFESFGNALTMAKVTSVIKHVFESSKFNFYICKPQNVHFNRKRGHY